jgi:hypothetical protein
MKNQKYEYITRLVETDISKVAHSSFDEDLESEGWKRAWADITTETTFIVYRRKLKR